ncbi:MAG TPA: ABC transporter permease [Chloroflexia bacterium]|nr:ABC transporter permease [Chloroflexia bacterium]
MNFRNVLLVLKREYMQRLRSPGFIIGTVVGILGLAALAFVPALLGLLDQGAAKVAVVDQHNLVLPTLEELSKPTPTPVPGTPNPAAPVSLSVGSQLRFSQATTTDTSVLDTQVTNGDISAYLIVQGDTASTATFTYHAKDRPGNLTSSQLSAYLSAALTQAKLKEFGISAQQAQSLYSSPQLTVVPVAGSTLKDEATQLQSIALVYVLLILLYVVILMYGVQVANGVVEEKSSRVMELLITAIRPIELMAGKVLGIGLAGLTQSALWVSAGLLVLLFRSVLGDATSGIGIDVASVPLPTLLAFLLFFMLGYVLYAAMYAALGSLVSKTEDVNSVTAPLTIVNVAVYLVSIYALSDPDAGFVKLLSFVPFFTPMLMFIRVALGTIAIWEFILGVVLVLIMSYLLTWLAAKIYRVGVLLYGKRPSAREILRLLRAG